MSENTGEKSEARNAVELLAHQANYLSGVGGGAETPRPKCNFKT